MKRRPLDYNPDVSRTLELDPRVASPFLVRSTEVSKEAIQERIENADFIPSDYRKRRDATRDRAPERPRNLNWIEGKIFNEGVEFRKYDEQARLNASRQAKIKIVYRQILDIHRQAMRKFNRARKMVDNCSERALERPTDLLRSAMRIVDDGPPITKKQAMIQAKEQVIRSD